MVSFLDFSGLVVLFVGELSVSLERESDDCTIGVSAGSAFEHERKRAFDAKMAPKTMRATSSEMMVVFRYFEPLFFLRFSVDFVRLSGEDGNSGFSGDGGFSGKEEDVGETRFSGIGGFFKALFSSSSFRNAMTLGVRSFFLDCIAWRTACRVCGETVDGIMDWMIPSDMSKAFFGICPESMWRRVAPRAYTSISGAK